MNNASILPRGACPAPDRFIPSNATLPPYGDEYAELEQHLSVRSSVGRHRESANDPDEQNPQADGKTGAEPGWLADDELTQDWFRRMDQYRSECDASDRARLLNDPTTGEAPSRVYSCWTRII